MPKTSCKTIDELIKTIIEILGDTEATKHFLELAIESIKFRKDTMKQINKLTMDRGKQLKAAQAQLTACKKLDQLMQKTFVRTDNENPDNMIIGEEADLGIAIQMIAQKAGLEIGEGHNSLQSQLKAHLELYIRVLAETENALIKTIDLEKSLKKDPRGKQSKKQSIRDEFMFTLFYSYIEAYKYIPALSNTSAFTKVVENINSYLGINISNTDKALDNLLTKYKEKIDISEVANAPKNYHKLLPPPKK